ncbi:MAG: tetratricopeptide (TPR) repeat protein, partial [Phenylobacterium sp.]
PITKETQKKRLDRAFVKKDAIKPIYQCLNNHDYRKAINYCDQLIKAKNKYGSTCYRIKADCLLRLGQPHSAQKIYEQFLASREISWALLGRARCKVHRSLYIEAIADYDLIIEGNRYALEAYDQKAESLLAIGEYEDAYRVLQQAVAISPNSPYRQRTTAILATRYHDYDSALTALRKVISLTKHLSQKQPDDYLKLAQILSLIHGRNMGQQSRRAPAELARLLKVMQQEFQANIQLDIATSIHHAVYDLMTGREIDGDIKIQQAIDQLTQLPDNLKPFLLDEIEFAHKVCSDHPLINTLFEQNCRHSAHQNSTEDIDKARTFNRQGMSKFREQDFETAFLSFKTAYLNARDNVNITLNLMQVMVKLINQHSIKNDFPELLAMFTQTYKLLDISDQRTTHFKLLFNNIKSQLTTVNPHQSDDQLIKNRGG